MIPRLHLGPDQFSSAKLPASQVLAPDGAGLGPLHVRSQASFITAGGGGRGGRDGGRRGDIYEMYTRFPKRKPGAENVAGYC